MHIVGSTLAFALFIQQISGFPRKRQSSIENVAFGNEGEDNIMAISMISSDMEKVGQMLNEFRAGLAERMKKNRLIGDEAKLLNIGSDELKREEEDDGKEVKKMDEKEQIYYWKAPSIAELNHPIGRLLYQGDIKLSLDQAEYLLTNLNLPASRHRRQAMNATKFPTFLWANRTVPYTFHPSNDQSTRQLIRQAIAFWSEMTCLDFREDELPADETNSGTTKLQFIRGTGCYSSVGKMSDETEQEISIGEGCKHFGIIAHEIAHALGFFHEQSRWDRDDYVGLHFENILDGYEDQFWKELPEDNDNQQVGYDLGSVMHYTESSFSKPDSGPVIIAKEPHNQRTMGQRIAPSFLDVLAMNKRYGCLNDCNGRGPMCQNGGYPMPKGDCSICICPWGFAGQLCQERQTSQGPFSSCGDSIETGPEWSEMEGRIGMDAEEIEMGNFSSCHWHIRAPEGKVVEIIVVELGKICSPGCFFGNTEFKMGADFGKTGIRMCCSSDLPDGGLRLRSETNLAVISIYTRKYIQKFRLKHRYSIF